ncbi:hypothetical protein C5Y93_18520 [Blastopirellula marina]|uniref:Uncharacterized protein n=1 Tax=Blastopirellula marina TaxID=124 RepID=A0A2S8GIZ2_9BACT|nr:hypothetical protein C5Y93_18520 [Blastopirellula marina]
MTAALKQRDAVAEEMLAVREKLETNDQRHEEEIVHLREALEVHHRSATAIESELKSIEAELRQQLVRQQDEFVQRLANIERQIHDQAERPMPTLHNDASEAELRALQAELRQQMVREQQEFVQRLAEVEQHMRQQAEKATQGNHNATAQGAAAEAARKAEFEALQTELHQQMVHQQEQFAQRIGEVERQVQKQAVRPAPAAPTVAPATVPSSGAMGELLHAHGRSHVAEKQIPNPEPIRQALAALDDPASSQQIAQLADQIFGPVDFRTLAQDEVIFLGTCTPGHTADQITLRMAAWISQQGGDVLVLDGALRAKKLSDQFGLRSSAGLFEFVRRETYRQDGTYRDQDTGLTFIPAGKSSFVLTASQADFTSLREQIREILKTNPIVLIAGEGPDLASSLLLAHVATQTFLQAELGQVTADEVRAAVDCFLQAGIELTGLVATNATK